MTTWAQPIRHPWFNSPTMKRKLSTDDDNASYMSPDVSSASFPTRRRKRVRYGSLERTLAHMTLGNALSTASEDADMWLKISPRGQETLNVVLPSSVEEPGIPVSESIDMEVEPALVTTDTSAAEMAPTHGVRDWESIASGQLEIKEVQISSAVLDCLRRQSNRLPAPIPISSHPSQALVLYRALRPPSPKPLERARDDKEEQPSTLPVVVAHEDDIMEVE